MPTFYPGQTDYIEKLNGLDAVATAQKGDPGSPGSPGATGPANTLVIGTVSTGSAAASITGVSPSQILNLTLPTGPTGPTGGTGPTGPANTLTIGTVTTGTAAASVTGSAPNQTLNLVLPTASPNTLTIGTVSAGTAAASITGSAPNQTLNLTLQTGATGAKGVNPRGAWAAATAYLVDDLATDSGSTYRRIVAGTTATAPGSDATNWQVFAQRGADGAGSVSTVNSVAPVAGNVTLTATNLGLGNVENKSSVTIRGELTSANVTTALTFTPYNATNPANYITSAGAPVQSVGGFTGAVTKTQLAINLVDNTADASKPVSTAQATAIALKANIASPAFTGNVGIGTAAATTTGLEVNRTVTGAATSYGVRATGVVQSDVTSDAMMFATAPGVAAGATVAVLSHFVAAQGTLTGTATNQIGFSVSSGMTGAGTNYGFYGNIAAAGARWNLYMNGTASNYMAGKLLLGSTTDTGEALQVTGDTRLGGAINEKVVAMPALALNPALGTIQTKTVAATSTFTDSLATGQSMVLMLSGGASFAVTWPTMTWVTSTGNVAPTLSANNTIVLWKVGSTLYGAVVGSY